MVTTVENHRIELPETVGLDEKDRQHSQYNSSTILSNDRDRDHVSNPRQEDDWRGCSGRQSLPLPGWSCRSFFLLLADNVISGLLIGPLTVFYWRGTWTLLERHWLPVYTVDSDGLSNVATASAANGWICLAVGNVGLLLIVYSQHFLNSHLKANRVVHWLIGYHVYTYVVAFFNVCHWRGVWTLLNVYTGTGEVSIWTSLAIGLAGLWILRSSRNAAAPPMVVVVDIVDNIFEYTTRFATKPADRELHFLDSLLTVFIIHQLVVFYWRGTWQVFDFYLFPEDKLLSAVTCLVVGYILQLLLCIAQPFLNVWYAKTSNDEHSSPTDAGFCRRWILETIEYFFANLVCVVHWRGVWVLLDVYVLPDRPDAAAILEHVVGIFGLWLMVAGHSVTLMGCLLDGGSEPKDGCKIRNQYVRYFIERFRSSDSDISVIT